MLPTYIFVFCVFIVFVNGKLPNIVLFLTDDQDILLGSMNPMSKTQMYIGNEGVTFENAFVNAPICCPSRSSLLTGRLPHNTQVKNNSNSGNCFGQHWRIHIEPFSIAAALMDAGYINFYAGKYLNQYTKHTHVPTGWKWWFGLIGNSRYYDYYLSENGTLKYYGKEKTDYLTDVILDKSLNFLNQKTIKDNPFFMVLAPPAPHAPFTPAARHSGSFPNIKIPRTPDFNHTPTEKHWLLQLPPIHLPRDVSSLDKIYEHRFESLLAVDEMVEKVVQKLVDINEINNTYLFFTSDNGFHMGQFGLPWDKRQPYDTDIRIPLLLRGPGLKKKILSKIPVQSVDIAPTILNIARITVPEYIDGTSFLKELDLEQTENKRNFEKYILIEYHGEGNEKSIDDRCPWRYDENLSECTVDSWCKCEDSKNNTYNCVRELTEKNNFLYCEMQDSQNFREAYDLSQDLYQLKNIYSSMSQVEINKYSNILKQLLKCTGKSCQTI